MRSAGCRHLYFKYCSTFDSTDAGNIGPVADALLDEVEDDFTIFCPAFPKNGRKIFNGYLFVGPVLLSESGMQNHPLTPMTDPNLVRVLQGQTRHKVGLIGFDAVNRGASAIRAEMQKLRGQGVRYAIVDAVDEDDLAAIGAAALDEGLVFTTGGSGLGGGLALSLRNPAESGTERVAMRFPKVQGPAAVIAGSCSRATLGQIEHFVKADKPFFRVEIGSLLAGKERVVAQALAWAKPRLGSEPLLIAASESPTAVAQHQQTHGREHVGHLIESALAEIARELVSAGVRRLILAGGETSSAAVERLDVRALRIGPTIDPGVPWTFSLGNDPLALALKSGNFGAADFFTSAFNKLPELTMTETKTREAICRLGASIFGRGLTPGSSGNISVRVDDGWLMTPTNASLGELDPATLSKLDDQGRLVSGDKETKESFLHLAVYDVRANAGAIVHLHSTHSVAVSCLADVNPADVLPPITAYYVMKIGTLPLIPYYRPGDKKLAEAVRAVAHKHHAVLLANHGPVVAGSSLSAAAAAVEELEETARLHLLTARSRDALSHTRADRGISRSISFLILPNAANEPPSH